jgi:hypothetical protein
MTLELLEGTFELPEELKNNKKLIENDLLDFIYDNGVGLVQYDAENNALVISKIQSMLKLTTILTYGSIAYLFLNYKNIDSAIILLITIFASVNAVSSFFFIKASFSKSFAPPFNEIKHLLVDVDFKLYDIKKWQLQHLQNASDNNRRRMKERGSLYKKGLIIFALTPLFAFLALILCTLN